MQYFVKNADVSKNWYSPIRNEVGGIFTLLPRANTRSKYKGGNRVNSSFD